MYLVKAISHGVNFYNLTESFFYCMTLDARKVSWILRETRSDEHETGSYC